MVDSHASSYQRRRPLSNTGSVLQIYHVPGRLVKVTGSRENRNLREDLLKAAVLVRFSSLMRSIDTVESDAASRLFRLLESGETAWSMVDLFTLCFVILRRIIDAKQFRAIFPTRHIS
jgi:hypothetical protein